MNRRLPRHTQAAVLIALAIFLLFAQSPALAVAPRPGLLEDLKEQGRLETYVRLRQQAQEKGVCTPGHGGLRKDRLAAGTMVDYYVPCILVDFTDNQAASGTNTTVTTFQNLLFSDNLNPTGSFKNYYSEVSYGQLNVIGVVSGWHRLPNTYDYYMNESFGTGGPYPQDTRGLVEAAVDAAEAAGFDFSLFDNNDDGYVDGVMVVVAGPGGEETGDSTDVHSHKWQIPNERFYDGKTISEFTIQPEEHAGGTVNSIGVFVHEWGHILELPDLYDLDNCADPDVCGDLLSSGIGRWSLMSLGNWLGSPEAGSKPAHLDAWCKTRLGLVTPTTIASNTVGTSIPAIEHTPTIFKLWANGLPGSQYFLVENRQRMGFDQYIPGKGLVIYHVDEAMSSLALGNRNQWIEGIDPPTPHMWVAVEQADGKFQLEKNEGEGDAFDPWYSDSAGFDQLSYPSTKDYNGTATQVAVWNLSAADSVMTANFDVTFSRPFLETSNYAFSDPAGDGDGSFEEGETFQLILDVWDGMLPANNVTVSVANDAGLTVIDDSYQIASIATGETNSNGSDPFEFAVPVGFASQPVTFTITTTTGSYVWTDQVTIPVGRPRFLIVDDDRADPQFIETWYFDSFDSLSQIYAHWDVNVRGIPPLDTLLTYPVVVWFTGDANTTHPLAPSVTVMSDFLDAGGNLFLTGQDIAANLAGRADSTFLRDYLGVRFGGNYAGFKIVNPIVADPISNGLVLNLGAAGGAPNQTSVDSLRLVTGGNAIKCYNWSATGSAAGVHVEDNYRAVFFAFGFEGVQTAVQNPGTQRHILLQRIIDWLDTDPGTGVFDDPGDYVTGVTPPKSYSLAQNYPNPFNAGTIIPFSLTAAGPRPVRLDIFNILGRRIRTLVNRTLEPGRHEIAWDGSDDQRRSLASGIYIYRLQIDGQGTEAKRMALLK